MEADINGLRAFVAAAEEERFSRRKHGKRPVPFAAWELPEQAMAWCLEEGGLRPQDLDAVAYSFDPALAKPAEEMGLPDPWDWLRVQYAERAPYDTEVLEVCLGRLPVGHPAVPLLKGRLAAATRS